VIERILSGNVIAMLSLRRAIQSKRQRLWGELDQSLAIIEFDPTGKIRAANDRFCRLLGYEATEIVGQHHRMIMEPAYAASSAYKDFWAKLCQGGSDRHDYLHVGKGGKQVWMQASYRPVLSRFGKLARIVQLGSDTTTALLRTAALEAKLAAIARVQRVIEFSPQGQVIDVNDNMLSLVGYRREEIIGKHHRLLVDSTYAASPEYEAFWRDLNAGKVNDGEFRRVGKGGRVIWMQASYNPVFDSNNKVVSILKFATDVTGRVKAVSEIAAGLAELASNHLDYRLPVTLEAAFEKVGSDYNTSLERLEMTIAQVAATSETILSGTGRIAAATSEMSRRIDEQAAGLGETAGALNQITGTVRQTAEGALEAAIAAAGARAGTASSSQVMSEAALVMAQISESSNKITQIIGVIDGIAFQTNLLALNAGVEAARAGETGRGFAVVAQEVRALAQRSAEAAKEIKSLIYSSSEEVKRGVELVNNTVAALDGVAEKVTQIDALLSKMAHSAQEQAGRLSSVNGAVNRIETATQQNALMTTQATEAMSTLKGEADEMARLIGQFRIGHAERAARPEPPPGQAEAPSRLESRPPRHRVPWPAVDHRNVNFVIKKD